jgi:hypothetical protein
MAFLLTFLKIQDEYTSTLTPVNLDESVPGTPRPLPLTTVSQSSLYWTL